MAALRRTYIYITSAFALQAAAWAAAFLLRGLLDPDTELVAAAVAFQVAVLVVTVPIYALHWRWADRLNRGDAEERESGARSFVLYAMLALFVLPIVANLYSVLAALLAVAFGDTADDLVSRLVRSIAGLVVFGVAAALVVRQLRADRESAGEPGRSAAFRRLYTFGLAAVGLGLGANGVVGLIQFLLRTVLPSAASLPAGAEHLADRTASALIGVGLWALLWRRAQRWYGAGDDDEARSTLRKLYLYAVVLIAVMTAVGNAAMLLAGMLRVWLGLESEGDWRVALSVIVVGAGLWAYHRHVLDSDAAAAEEAPRQAALRWLYSYLVAAVGLGATLAGLVGLVNVALRAAFHASTIGDAQREILAWSIAGVAAGLSVWLLPWRRAQGEAIGDSAEAAAARGAIPRKAYLYFYLLVSAVALISSAVYLVYRLVGVLLGEVDPDDDMGLDIARALALASIAAAAWGYHLRVLRADGDLDAGVRRRRLSDLAVLVVGAGDGKLGAAVLAALAREAPEVRALGLGMDSVADDRLRDAAAQSGLTLERPEDAATAAASADVVIAPWSAFVPGGAGSVDQPLAAALAASSAHRLVLPTSAEGWSMVGVGERVPNDIANDAVAGLIQHASGEPVVPKNRLSVPALILIGLGILILMLAIGLPLAAFIGSLT